MTFKLRASRFIARHFGKKTLPLSKGKGVISFSFDDVPASACHVGAQLIESYNGTGSFFVCGSLTAQKELDQFCHSESDLLKLSADGHEIGCHTYSHLNCANNSIDALVNDWDKNLSFLGNLGIKPYGFAYPFGAYDWKSKKEARDRFEYIRITGGGTHIKTADIASLRAQALYQSKANLELVDSLIEKTAREGGWLIFYTHEVSETPGPFGCTPHLLEHALKRSKEFDCEILSIHRAINFFRS